METKKLKFTLKIPRWTMAEDLGYTPITTFWQDFSIADKFGPAAIRDTFKRAFAEWKGNYKYLTELVMVIANIHTGDVESSNALCQEICRRFNEFPKEQKL